MERGAGYGVQVTEAGLQLPVYDYLSNAPTSLTDVYTFKIGGAAGTVVCVVTVVYTTSAKSTIDSVTRTPALK